MSKIRKQSIDDIYIVSCDERGDLLSHNQQLEDVGVTLKPCPFCGSNATKGKTEDDCFFVACTKCILYLQCEPWDQKGLIEIWNKRANAL